MTAFHISSGALHAHILARGAALVGVRLGGTAHNFVLGFANPEDHLNIPVYAGALVGPVANRITGGHVTLDGISYRMPCNENGTTTLHSGDDGLHARLWEVSAQAQDRITLSTTLQPGDQGLPGHRQITATYSVTGTTLQLEITARTDAPTPINIAAHPYWQLDDKPDISGHTLHIDAGAYTPTDPANLPTGEVSPVAGTLFDFRTPRPVPLDPALDANFCLGSADRATPQAAATLTGADGTRLQISTTAPGLQVYNGAYLPRRAGVLDDGRDLHPYAGIALEPQFWPDAPNQPGFPQITLYPGALWRQVTTYHLTAAH